MNRLPFDTSLEAQVLGGVLLHPNTLPRVVEMLSEADFYNTTHRKFYVGILEMFEAGEPIGYESLEGWLKTKGTLGGDSDKLVEVCTQTTSESYVEFNAKIVKQFSLLRGIVRLGTAMANEATLQGSDPFDILNNSEQKLLEMSGVLRNRKAVPLGKLIPPFIERLDEIRTGKRETFGTSSGFRGIDDLIGGFCPGELYIIAGRPSMGKTGLAICIARNIGEKEAIGFFSIEMEETQILARLLSIETGIENYRFRTGRLMESDILLLSQVGQKVSALKIYVDDQAAPNLLEIKAKCKRMVMEYGVKGIVIDYLGLVRAPQHERKDLEIGYVTSGLKAMAKELGLYVILLCQLSRSVEKREDKRPELSDLRDSGNIEQDADVVMFIYRPEYYEKENCLRPGIAEVIVAKQRSGPTGVVDLNFKRECVKFEAM